jgi:hypothetical protein
LFGLAQPHGLRREADEQAAGLRSHPEAGASEDTQAPSADGVRRRIRHFGLFANTSRAANLARARTLLACATPSPAPVAANDDATDAFPCPCCGGRMRLIEVFQRGARPRASFTPRIVGVDSS